MVRVILDDANAFSAAMTRAMPGLKVTGDNQDDAASGAISDKLDSIAVCLNLTEKRQDAMEDKVDNLPIPSALPVGASEQGSNPLSALMPPGVPSKFETTADKMVDESWTDK